MIKMNAMKIVRLIPALLLVALLASCNSTKKLYQAQKYDQVIQKLAPEATRDQLKDNKMEMLSASYHNANQADHERIQALKATGKPDAWPEIYQRYCSMKGRNDALSKLPMNAKKSMNYSRLNLNDDLVAARNKAESFLVAKANQLLNSYTKADAEEAQQYIEQLARTNPENKSLLDLRKKQMLCATDKLTLRVANETPMLKSVVDAMLDFDDDEIPYDLYLTEKSSAHIIIDVRNVTVSPVRLDEVSFKENNGDKTVVVTDHTQNKSATISGVMEFRDKGKKLICAVPFEAKSTFKNDYTTIKGDREACSAETLKRLSTEAVPVPTDESMLMDAAKKLNDLIALELKK